MRTFTGILGNIALFSPGLAKQKGSKCGAARGPLSTLSGEANTQESIGRMNRNFRGYHLNT